MKYANSKLSVLLATLTLVVFTGGAAWADDTELFVAGLDPAANSNVRPNVLFIIDTSGSMGTNVKTQVAYDESIDFSGGGSACYRRDAIYWSLSNSPPDCSSDRYFWKSRNLCQDSQERLKNLGEYSGPLLQWRVRSNRDDKWVTFNANNPQPDRYVECEADRGKSGFWLNDGKYAADGDQYGPFADNYNREPAWTTTYYLFNGNYLNWLKSGGVVDRTRLEIVQDVTTNLVETLTGVNVGLMRFNFEQGGPVIKSMENIATARAGMIDAISKLNDDGWTPLSETLYEAYQYYRGGPVGYGNVGPIRSVDSARTAPGSNTYDSPIEFACQKNFVVLLTDGEPTRDVNAENAIESMIGKQCERNGLTNNDGQCLDELAEHMHNTDASPLLDKQNITTYTIGFAVDLQLLDDTATKGGGEYFLADNTTTLSTALTRIAISILDQATTFSAPSVPVNAFNRTQNLDDVFVSVFQPSSTVRWPGNLKRYALADGKLVDRNGGDAVDPATGYFSQTAWSFWSPTRDGNRPPEGGAASQLPDYWARRIFSNVAGSDLNAAANRIQPNNSVLTPEMLGAPDDFDDVMNMTELRKTVQWLNGWDVHDENDNDPEGDGPIDTYRSMGDPLHVRPTPVIYGGTPENPDMIVFTSTNAGMLHAIDADTGAELWSFVPERLLRNSYSLYKDSYSARRMYGLDGQIVAHIVNDDKIPGISSNERVILLFGMRRGGNAVFAVDVTDRNDPQLMWEIDETTSGFADIGQTWSTPEVARVNVNGTIRNVAIFGGGYDTGQDTEQYRTDSLGNAVYMVDLLTGQKIWSAGKSSDHDLRIDEMEHSIPAPVRLIDINNDTLTDRIYVGDMGGRVWRFDLTNGNPVSTLGSGGMIASLGAADIDNPTAADLRRFYNQIDVVDVMRSGYRYLALNIGSGYRAHPLDRKINEEFYSIRDFDVFNALATDDYGPAVTQSDMVDVTADANTTVDATASGWRLSMDVYPGEKVLGRALTFDGVVYFTSFAPGTGATACSAVEGQNRLYKVSLLSGSPVANLDGTVDDTNLETTDRSTALVQGGIAPEVVFLFPEEAPDRPIVCSGLECDEAGALSLPTRTYWTQSGAE